MRLTEEEIHALAEAGAAAPSGGNMQAWKVVARADRIDLFLDEERSTAFIDVDRAGSLLGLGSFTENVALEARARGFEHDVEVRGLRDVSEPVVRFVFRGRGVPDASPLAAAIRARATDRKPWNGETIDDATLVSLGEAAASVGSGYGLVGVHGEDKAAVAEALAEADVVRTFNRTLHEGMLSELRWTKEEAEATRDGIDLDTLELTPGDRKGLGLMRRRWFVSLFVTRNRVRSMTREALLASSHLCAITMPRTATTEELVTAGRAVQRVWLSAEVAGLALQPWCVIPFFALRAERHPETFPDKDRASVLAARERLDRLFSIDEGSRMIFVFRLARAEPPSALALRRPTSAFTRIED